MKVVGIDNYAREHIADILVQADMTFDEADARARQLNEESGEHASRWYVVRPDDYVLSRGMEDLV